MKKNHHAKLENSPRLQRVLKVLQGGGWYSTMEIATRSRNVATSTSISELKSNGIKIERRRESKKDGTQVHYYRLVPKEQLSFLLA